MARSMAVPELVRQRAMSNAAGQRWLDDLDAVVAELCDRWELQLGRSMSGGTASFVATAVDGAGRSCVLKVAMPLDQDELDTFERSVLAHRLADGRGCAPLLDQSTTPPAMLLERLGPNLDELAMSVPDVLTRRRAELLAALCDVDPEPVWQWGFIERVSTGLANLREFDDKAAGMAFLEVATRCLSAR